MKFQFLKRALKHGGWKARKYWPGQEGEYAETFRALLEQGVSAKEAQEQSMLKA